MAIRKAEETDVAGVRAIAEAAYRPYVAVIGRAPAPMVADFESAADAGDLHVLELDGRAMAYIHLYPKDKALHIENLAVVPEARRQGLASRLLTFAESEARRLGLSHLDLYTNEAMESAQALYLASGFREIDRRVEAGFRRVYLQKALESV